MEAIMEMNTMADWEKWVELAREDPEKFEKERAAAIEELIISQPTWCRHRSRQLQWKIDAVRQTSPNGLCACIRIYNMLIDAAYGPNGLIEAIETLDDKNRATDRRVVPVRKKGFLLHFSREKKME
jgi:hypothetical protein